mgnify:CR=1 FL=1
MDKTLTIGMAHHNDFSGVYFTIQDIRKELIFNQRPDLLNKINFLIIENDPESEHAKAVANLKHQFNNIEIINFNERSGTSATRNKIIEEARTDFVLVVDCHVVLCPVVSALDKLFQFMEYNPRTEDLYQGPLVHDNLQGVSTHFNDEWGAQMWGRWGHAWNCVCESYNFSVIETEDKKCKFVNLATQEEIKSCDYCKKDFPEDLEWAGHDRKLYEDDYRSVAVSTNSPPFEIFAQGLGLFFTRKNSWLGFNEHAKGFGGEECYIHEKYRKAGRKAMCLPFLRWLHRFGRPDGVKYELTAENKVRNYVLEFTEIGLDLLPLREHFLNECGFDEKTFNGFVEEASEIYNTTSDNVYNRSDKDILKEIEKLKSQLSLQAPAKKGCCGKWVVNSVK